MQAINLDLTFNPTCQSPISPWMVSEDLVNSNNNNKDDNNNNNSSSSSRKLTRNNILAYSLVEQRASWPRRELHPRDCEDSRATVTCDSNRLSRQPRDVNEWLARLSLKDTHTPLALQLPGEYQPAGMLGGPKQDMLTQSSPETQSEGTVSDNNACLENRSSSAKSAVNGNSPATNDNTVDSLGCNGTVSCTTGSNLTLLANKKSPLGSSTAEVPSSLPSPRSINGCSYTCGDILTQMAHCSAMDNQSSRTYEVDATHWPSDCSVSSSSYVSPPSSRSSSSSRFYPSSPTSTTSFCDELSSISASPPSLPTAALSKLECLLADIPSAGSNAPPRPQYPVRSSGASHGRHNSIGEDPNQGSMTPPVDIKQRFPYNQITPANSPASPDTPTNTSLTHVSSEEPAALVSTPVQTRCDKREAGHKIQLSGCEVIRLPTSPATPRQSDSELDFAVVKPELKPEGDSSKSSPTGNADCQSTVTKSRQHVKPQETPEMKDTLPAPRVNRRHGHPAKTSPRISRRDTVKVEVSRGETDSGCETSGSLSDLVSSREITSLCESSQASLVSLHSSSSSAAVDCQDGHYRGQDKYDPDEEREDMSETFLDVSKKVSGFKSYSDVDSDEDSEDQRRPEQTTGGMPPPLSANTYNPYPREYTPPSSPLSKRRGSQWRRPSVKKRGKISRLYTDDDEQWIKKFTSAYKGLRMSIPDPSDQRLNWTKPPLSVLIIRKHLDSTVLMPFRDLVIWLVEEKSMLVYVEQKALKESHLLEDKDFEKVYHKLKPFKEGVDDLTDKVDFIICLGGDGTLLYVSSLFQGSVPPVMAFNMGSLGFLTPFQFSQDFKQEVSRVMQGSASLLLRYRLKCVVMKHETGESYPNVPHVKNIQKEHKLLKTHKLVLNEVVLDRGPSSYLSNLDLYIEGRRVTTVQGDGLIISTPTGSTAYAVSAGASMIHPSVPCILLTPICPHSLSFRPIVVPAGVEIKLMLNPNSRGTAMVSFDGRDRQEIGQGDSLRITTAAYPVPSICGADQIEDWFDGLAVCLNWNIRAQQRPLQRNPSLTSIDSVDSATDLGHFSNGYLSGSNGSKGEVRGGGADDKNSNNSAGRGASAGERRTSGRGEGKGHSRKPSSN